MKFEERQALYAGRKKIVKVDEKNNPIGHPPIYVNIENADGGLIPNGNDGTPINVENLNKGNWRDDKSLSFANLIDDILPEPDDEDEKVETKIVAKNNGEVWVIPAKNRGDNFKLGKGTKIIVNNEEQETWDANTKLDIGATAIDSLKLGGKTETELNVSFSKGSGQAENSNKLSGKTASEFATIEQGTKADTAYQKINTGIPKTDLDAGVQASLDNADNAVGKVTTANKLYATTSAGENTTYGWSQSEASAHTIPMRTEDGCIMVNDPTEQAHTANKRYVDSGLLQLKNRSLNFIGFISPQVPESMGATDIRDGDYWLQSPQTDMSAISQPLQMRLRENGVWTQSPAIYNLTSMDTVLNMNDDKFYYYLGTNWFLMSFAGSQFDTNIFALVNGAWSLKDNSVGNSNIKENAQIHKTKLATDVQSSLQKADSAATKLQAVLCPIITTSQNLAASIAIACREVGITSGQQGCRVTFQSSTVTNKPSGGAGWHTYYIDCYTAPTWDINNNLTGNGDWNCMAIGDDSVKTVHTCWQSMQWIEGFINVATKSEINSKVSKSGDTINGTLNINGQTSDASGQMAFIKAIHQNDTDSGWRGRIMNGDINRTFLLGVYNNICGLGAHSWTDANAGTGAAWEDVFINPDGDKKVLLGKTGAGWNKSNALLEINNAGNGSAMFRCFVSGSSPVIT